MRTNTEIYSEQVSVYDCSSRQPLFYRRAPSARAPAGCLLRSLWCLIQVLYSTRTRITRAWRGPTDAGKCKVYTACNPRQCRLLYLGHAYISIDPSPCLHVLIFLLASTGVETVHARIVLDARLVATLLFAEDQYETARERPRWSTHILLNTTWFSEYRSRRVGRADTVGFLETKRYRGRAWLET